LTAHRSYRNERVSPGMFIDNHFLLQPLGPGGADIVFLEHFKHRGTGNPEDESKFDIGKGKNRSQKMPEGIPENVQPPIE